MSWGNFYMYNLQRKCQKWIPLLGGSAHKIQVTKMVQSNEKRNNLGRMFSESYIETWIHKIRRVAPSLFPQVGKAVGPLRFINYVSLAVKLTAQASDFHRYLEGKRQTHLLLWSEESSSFGISLEMTIALTWVCNTILAFSKASDVKIFLVY